MSDEHIEKLRKKYSNIKTGQDMINAGIIPKTSSESLSAISKERLTVIKQSILDTITDDMLGAWVPALKTITEKLPSEITDVNEIKKIAAEGLKVVATDNYGKFPIKGLEGTIMGIENNSSTVKVKFNQPFEGGHTLGGLCADGYGLTIDNYKSLKLITKGKTIIKAFQLREDTVADEQGGHFVRFNNNINVNAQSRSGYSNKIEVTKKNIGKLIEYDQSNHKIIIEFEKPLSNGESKFQFDAKEIYKCLEVSSIGQQKPLERDEEIKKLTLKEFFSTTELETDKAEFIATALIMGKDLVFYGAPGGGKSQAAKDCVSIAQQQGVIFKVIKPDSGQSCQNNCNPYSLFDKDFAKKLPACPACKIAYDPDFKDKGFFKMPKAKDVNVLMAKYAEGHGIEKINGTTDVNGQTLAGYKLPNFDGATEEEFKDESNPKGFRAGTLVRTNNGVLHFDEIDKIKTTTMDHLLAALNDESIRPNELKFSCPTNSLIIGTANEQRKITGPINDRMFLIAIRYTKDVDVSHAITLKAFYGQVKDTNHYDVGDVHQMPVNGIKNFLIPLPIEKAISKTYIQFRETHNISGQTDETKSNRSLLDALAASQAELAFDQIFYTDVPAHVTMEYAIRGIATALTTRVQIEKEEDDIKTKKLLVTWATENYPNNLNEEENNFWCKFYKDAISPLASQIPEINSNLKQEIEEYKVDSAKAKSTFNLIKSAYENPDNVKLQQGRIKFPFMDFLYREQPGINKVSQEGLVKSIEYFMETHERTTASVDEL
ncbi:MAG: hypothetical protein ABIC91_07180 [Nanoarchaeota archaeon]|nr:hypothetical protein [Nanoarchaeota archaeon]MBU1031093.1 hypothetical protein [Nanoarchaeota archaeon]MBU1849690.1 hypothetical protein [Nanoarchaeota archaeon]